MAKSETPKPAKKERFRRTRQLGQSYQMTKRTDPRLPLVIAAWFVLGFLVGGGLFLLTGSSWWMAVVGAVLFGVLAGLFVFGRRAQRSMYTQMEGQTGSAAAALGLLRRGWKIDSAVAFNKQQDVVHRVVGPPGIVLVGEGNPNRLRSLLASERRKHERVVADVPVREVVCGRGEGAVPIDQLVKHVRKMGRELKPAQMTDVLARLRALDASRSNIPLPKGPLPTNMRGARQNLRGR